MAMAYRIVALLTGGIAVYLGLFLYLDERGKIQNRLIDVWASATALGEGVAQKFVLLVVGLAQIVNAGLDQVFGKKLVSVHAFLVSAAMSAGSFTLIFSHFCRPLMNSQTDEKYYLVGVPCSVLAICSPLLPAASPILKTPKVLGAALSVFGLLGTAFWWSGLHGLEGHQSGKVGWNLLIFCLFIAGGILCNVIFAGVARWILRWAAAGSEGVPSATLMRVTQAGVLSLIFTVALVGPGVFGFLRPDTVFVGDDSPMTEIAFALYSMVSWTNLVSGLISISLVSFLAMAVLNRLFWPAVARSVYVVVDTHLILNRRLLTVAGLLLMSTALPEMGRGIKALVKLPW
jgi:hypothetical protein